MLKYGETLQFKKKKILMPNAWQDKTPYLH